MKQPDIAVLLTPGAGSSSTHQSLVAIDDAIVQAARTHNMSAYVRRVDFPYRLAGRAAPDRAPVLIATIVDAVNAVSAELDIPTNQIVIGGRSMGGRMCSMAIAEGLAVRALVCVSYPLHPPGKLENLRIAHFGDIAVPTLFVSGDRDAFGTPAEFATHTPTIAGPFTQQWIEGGDHSLGRKNHAKIAASMVADWIIGQSSRTTKSAPKTKAAKSTSTTTKPRSATTKATVRKMTKS